MMPRWMKWLFVLFLGYLLVMGNRAGNHPTATQDSTVPAITAKSYPSLSKALDAERWKRGLNPDYAARFNCSFDAPHSGPGLIVSEETPGEGKPAECGDTLQLDITLWNAAGEKSYEGKLPVALGTRGIAAGLDAGLLGIRPLGVRTIVLPPTALARGKGAVIPAELLHALTPGHFTIVTVKRLS